MQHPARLKCVKAAEEEDQMIERIRKGFAESNVCYHGGRAREAALSFSNEPLDFSASINPLGCPDISEVLCTEMERLGHYPDNTYMEFRRAAATYIGVDPVNIVPGNGSSEIIRLFAETTLNDGDRAIIPFPTFGEYENQSRLFGARTERIKLDHNGFVGLDNATLKDAKVLFICNPNNPTGLLLPKGRIEELARRCENSETFLLVDEAFIELSDPDQTVAALAREMDYLVVMRSLTKSFGVPGLRLGYGVTNSTLSEIMNRARIPWSISSIASAAAVQLFKQTDHLNKARALVSAELVWLTDELERLGLKPQRSMVNFILVDIEPSGLSSSELAMRMMAEGILIRDCQSFGLGERYIRVAVRDRDENTRLVAALKRVGCTG
jgi:threonine-phosphate decarboxylase